MNILMLTNVFTPQVGGVTRSIQRFVATLRNHGHRVLIIAPDYGEPQAGEIDVLRVASIAKFYDGVYPLPLPGFIASVPEIGDFQPDVVHSHHPFLLGSAGQQIAADLDIPIVYTHHTRYSIYIETKTNWPKSVEAAIAELVIAYCNLCDSVIAPSEGVRSLLIEAGVTEPIEVISTGVDLCHFSHGDGAAVRRRHGIPADAAVIGHLGRLAPEKNLGLLASSIVELLRQRPDVHCLIVGDGPTREAFASEFADAKFEARVHFDGMQEGQNVVDAYHAMDVFAFTSFSETQGMVLAEAMAAGVPVVAVDAVGVRDLVRHDHNGWLLMAEDPKQFAQALNQAVSLPEQNRATVRNNCRATAEEFGIERSVEQLLHLYSKVCEANASRKADRSDWQAKLASWETLWQRWYISAQAVASGVKHIFTAEVPKSI